MLTPWPHQKEKAEQLYRVLKANGLAYLAMEERTGKTVSAILTAEMCVNVVNVLVVTKKGKPLDGWKETVTSMDLTCTYTVTNYHQAFKLVEQELDFDLIILDESHNYISSYPKLPGGKPKAGGKPGIWWSLSLLCKQKPIIYVSATPHAQGYQMLYHQLKLSSWTPFSNYRDYYSFFRRFGIPNTVFVNGRQVEQYNRVKEDELKPYVKDLFVTGTRKELGFEQEPCDSLHFVELSKETRAVYNELMKERVAEFNGLELICDTPMKLRTSLHQIEGGALKFEDKPLELTNCEKIDYIKQTWGDTDQLVIFYHYIAEGIKLRKHFSNAVILQGITNAEGVDLSMYDTLVIYSQDFSTAKHTQRRARQANKHRDKPIVVNYLLVDQAISHQCYNTVAINKENFVDSVFERVEI